MCHDPGEDAVVLGDGDPQRRAAEGMGRGLHDPALGHANHVECCTYPVLNWIAEHVPTAPVNIMAQFHPDNFCDPGSAKYRDKYAEIARRTTPLELNASWSRARELGLKFEMTTFERRDPFTMAAMFGV